MKFGTTVSAAVLVLGIAVAPALSAQNPGGGPRGGRMQAMALEGITLTPAQQTQVDSIAAKARAQMPAMTPGTPPSEADRQKMMGVSMASLADVRKVLTPEQQQVFDKNMAAIKERIQAMQGKQGGGSPPAAPTQP